MASDVSRYAVALEFEIADKASPTLDLVENKLARIESQVSMLATGAMVQLSDISTNLETNFAKISETLQVSGLTSTLQNASVQVQADLSKITKSVTALTGAYSAVHGMIGSTTDDLKALAAIHAANLSVLESEAAAIDEALAGWTKISNKLVIKDKQLEEELKKLQKENEEITKAGKGFNLWNTLLKQAGDSVEAYLTSLVDIKQAVILAAQATEEFRFANYRLYGSQSQLAEKSQDLAASAGLFRQQTLEAYAALMDVRVPLDMLDKLAVATVKLERVSGVSTKTTAAWMRSLMVLGTNGAELERRTLNLAVAMNKFGLSASDINSIISEQQSGVAELVKKYGSLANVLLESQLASTALAASFGGTTEQIHAIGRAWTRMETLDFAFVEVDAARLGVLNNINTALGQQEYLSRAGLVAAERIREIEATSADQTTRMLRLQFLQTELSVRSGKAVGDAVYQMGILLKRQLETGTTAEQIMNRTLGVMDRQADAAGRLSEIYDSSNQSLIAQLKLSRDIFTSTFGSLFNALEPSLVAVLQVMNSILMVVGKIFKDLLVEPLKAIGTYLMIVGRLLTTFIKLIVAILEPVGMIINKLFQMILSKPLKELLTSLEKLGTQLKPMFDALVTGLTWALHVINNIVEGVDRLCDSLGSLGSILRPILGIIMAVIFVLGPLRVVTFTIGLILKAMTSLLGLFGLRAVALRTITFLMGMFGIKLTAAATAATAASAAAPGFFARMAAGLTMLAKNTVTILALAVLITSIGIAVMGLAKGVEMLVQYGMSAVVMLGSLTIAMGALITGLVIASRYISKDPKAFLGLIGLSIGILAVAGAMFIFAKAVNLIAENGNASVGIITSMVIALAAMGAIMVGLGAIAMASPKIALGIIIVSLALLAASGSLLMFANAVKIIHDVDGWKVVRELLKIIPALLLAAIPLTVAGLAFSVGAVSLRVGAWAFAGAVNTLANAITSLGRSADEFKDWAGKFNEGAQALARGAGDLAISAPRLMTGAIALRVAAPAFVAAVNSLRASADTFMVVGNNIMWGGAALANGGAMMLRACESLEAASPRLLAIAAALKLALDAIGGAAAGPQIGQQLEAAGVLLTAGADQIDIASLRLEASMVRLANLNGPLLGPITDMFEAFIGGITNASTKLEQSLDGILLKLTSYADRIGLVAKRIADSLSSISVPQVEVGGPVAKTAEVYTNPAKNGEPSPQKAEATDAHRQANREIVQEINGMAMILLAILNTLNGGKLVDMSELMAFLKDALPKLGTGRGGGGDGGLGNLIADWTSRSS